MRSCSCPDVQLPQLSVLGGVLPLCYHAWHLLLATCTAACVGGVNLVAPACGSEHRPIMLCLRNQSYKLGYILKLP